MGSLVSHFSDPTRRVFFLCGNTHDEFWPTDLLRLDLERLLQRHLVALGYKRVVYVNTMDKVFFWDSRSYTLSKPRDAQKHGRPGQSGSEAAISIPPGPLGRGPLLLRRSHSGKNRRLGDSSRCRDIDDPMSPSLLHNRHCHPSLDDSGISVLLRNFMEETDVSRGPTAIIFTDGLAFLSHYGLNNSPALQMLAGCMENWLNLPATNRNICCFIFQNQMLEDVNRFIETFGSWSKLRSLLFSTRSGTPEPSERVITLGSPHADEIAAIIHYHRLLYDVSVDRATLPETLDRLARHWRCNRKEAKRLSYRIQEFCSKENTLNSAVLGSLIEQNPKGTALERLLAMKGIDSVVNRVHDWLREHEEKTGNKRGSTSISAVQSATGSCTERLLPQPADKRDINLHFVLTGRPGTGKTVSARLIAEIFAEKGLLPSGHLVEVKRDDLISGYVGQTAIKTMEVIESAMGGMLFIDEAYGLNPRHETDFAHEAVVTLVKAMEDRKGQFSVVAAGYPEKMHEFLQSNEGLQSRFGDNIIEMPEYDADTLRGIFEDIAADGGRSFEPELKAALPSFFKKWWRANHRKSDFGFARDVKEKLFSGVENGRRRRVSDLDKADPARLEIKLVDVPENYTQYLPGERSDDLESLLEELEAMVGLKPVKEAVKKLNAKFHLSQKQGESFVADLTPGYYAFIGNPGTGKTEVAQRLFGKLLFGIGLLKQGHTVEATSSCLIGNCLVETVEKTKKCIADAMEGVLFVDYPHMLFRDDPISKKALELLICKMKENREHLCVIMTGGNRDIRQFIDNNKALRELITSEIEFPNYKPDELVRIFTKMAIDQGLRLGRGTEDLLHKLFDEEIKSIAEEEFGNAHQARILLQAARDRMATRLSVEIDDIPEGDQRLTLIEAEDIAVPQQEISLEAAMAPLDQLVGLVFLKEQIRKWSDKMVYEMNYGDDSAVQAPGHYLFLGNPGTGKTTVARMIGEILKALGYLKRGHLVEVKRGDLVAGWLGQTAIKTKERFKDALGGVLFVDEAYSLVEGERDSFGKEALNTLLHLMEDHRSKLCVIFAGYQEPTLKLLKTNPGMLSRFSGRFIFDDYSPAEMVEIFRLMAAERKLELAPEVPNTLLPIFRAWTEVKDPHFGNAREVRKLFDAARENLASRVVNEARQNRPVDSSFYGCLTVTDIHAAASNVR